MKQITIFGKFSVNELNRAERRAYGARYAVIDETPARAGYALTPADAVTLTDSRSDATEDARDRAHAFIF